MDYKDLLNKYIDHVVDCEGVTFLADHHRERNDRRLDTPRFTDEEWAALQAL